MFPTLSEAVQGERLTVAAPFFNKWLTPVGLVLLFLTGVGPLLAWRKSTVGNMVHQFMWPTGIGALTGSLVVALGVPFWSSGLCFALCGFVMRRSGRSSCGRASSATRPARISSPRWRDSSAASGGARRLHRTSASCWPSSDPRAAASNARRSRHHARPGDHGLSSVKIRSVTNDEQK
jgi:hypothetical protein